MQIKSNINIHTKPYIMSGSKFISEHPKSLLGASKQRPSYESIKTIVSKQPGSFTTSAGWPVVLRPSGNIAKIQPSTGKLFDWSWLDDILEIASDLPIVGEFARPIKAIKKMFGGGKKEKKEKKRERVKERVERGDTLAPMKRSMEQPQHVVLDQKPILYNPTAWKNMQNTHGPGSFASMPPAQHLVNKQSSPRLKLTGSGIPVLGGQSGTRMVSTPVAIEKTSDHCVMAGTEFYDYLSTTGSSTVAGEVVTEWYINPVEFVGTRLQLECKGWQSYRFRKLVIEYVPQIASDVGGSFIGFFTNDVSEEFPETGIPAVRAAEEHEGSVCFQPFTYTAIAYSRLEQDNRIFFCEQMDNSDARLVWQTCFRVINAATNDATSFGQLLLHYEIDFFYPKAPDGLTNGVTYPLTGYFVTAGLTPLTVIDWFVPVASWPAGDNIQIGNLYYAQVLAYTAGTGSPVLAWNTDVMPTNYANGQIVFLKVRTRDATNIAFLCYLNLAEAVGGSLEQALRVAYGSANTAANTATTFSRMSRITPNVLRSIEWAHEAKPCFDLDIEDLDKLFRPLSKPCQRKKSKIVEIKEEKCFQVLSEDKTKVSVKDLPSLQLKLGANRNLKS
jgi:hypothetical protein